MSARCMAIVIYSFSGLYKKTHIQSEYNVTGKKPQPRLNCHYKFISAKNIIFVSSDDKHA